MFPGVFGAHSVLGTGVRGLQDSAPVHYVCGSDSAMLPPCTHPKAQQMLPCPPAMIPITGLGFQPFKKQAGSSVCSFSGPVLGQ